MYKFTVRNIYKIIMLINAYCLKTNKTITKSIATQTKDNKRITYDHTKINEQNSF